MVRLNTEFTMSHHDGVIEVLKSKMKPPGIACFGSWPMVLGFITNTTTAVAVAICYWD